MHSNNSNSLDKVIKETKSTFEAKVISLATKTSLSYLESIIKIMEDNNYEVEFVQKLLTPRLKKTLEVEAKGLNMLKAKNNNDGQKDA